MPEAERKPGDPYCSNCGYDLVGTVDSPRCPECGRPLVEVLVRQGQMTFAGRRYRSPIRLFGLPLIDIAMGPGPDGVRGKAKGFVAIGDSATGVLAMGGTARGVVALGGVAMGGFTAGGCSLGLFSAVGGCAVGGFAMGGGAAGGFAQGGGALGFMAQGGLGVGYHARGGGAIGVHTVSMGGGADPIAVNAFDAMSWYFGAWPMDTMSLLTSFGAMVVLTFFLAAIIGAIAWIRHNRSAPAH